MSLVFKVAKLREAAVTAVKRFDDARHQYMLDVEAYRGEHYQEWMDNHVEGVVAVRNYLSECIKANKAPKHSEARKRFGSTSDLYFYSTPSPNTSSVPTPSGYHNARIDTTRAMVSFLDAYEGDTITAAQLKVVGFDDLASLYREAVGS